MAKTAAQRQATYRAKHAEKVAAYRDENKARQDAEYRARHADKIQKRMRDWNEQNAERAAENKRRYYEEHKEIFVAKARAWQQRNPEKTKANVYVQTGKRRAAKLRATPKWANAFFISEIYDLARRRNKSRSCGVKWHVDHIVPLRGKNVCGLHVENNLQVIPAIENMKKTNAFSSADITERI